jgi:hypothetical protein
MTAEAHVMTAQSIDIGVPKLELGNEKLAAAKDRIGQGLHGFIMRTVHARFSMMGTNNFHARQLCRLSIKREHWWTPEPGIVSRHEAISKISSMVFVEKKSFLQSFFLLYFDILCFKKHPERGDDRSFSQGGAGPKHPFRFQESQEANNHRFTG